LGGEDYLGPTINNETKPTRLLEVTMTRRLLARLIPVLGIALLAACSNLTGPQASTLSSSAVTGQDQQQATEQGPRQGTGKNAGQKPSAGIQ
jgi:outer membrane biogenesis lipoprotein LolB